MIVDLGVCRGYGGLSQGGGCCGSGCITQMYRRFYVFPGLSSHSNTQVRVAEHCLKTHAATVDPADSLRFTATTKSSEYPTYSHNRAACSRAFVTISNWSVSSAAPFPVYCSRESQANSALTVVETIVGSNRGYQGYSTEEHSTARKYSLDTCAMELAEFNGDLTAVPRGSGGNKC